MYGGTGVIVSSVIFTDVLGARVVLPVRLDSLGPQIVSTLLTSCSAIGQLRNVLLSIILRSDLVISPAVSWNRLADCASTAYLLLNNFRLFLTVATLAGSSLFNVQK